MNANIKNLLDYLDSLNARADLSVLQRLLSENKFSLEDLVDHCKFDDNHYARNKVSCSPWYDLYVMCWKPGQSSAIHDHLDSSCSFKILKGEATEIEYTLSDLAHHKVSRGTSRNYSIGQVCSAQDQEIHKISNLSNSEDLVTMHIYSPPLKMSVYDEDIDLPNHAPTSNAPSRTY